MSSFQVIELQITTDDPVELVFPILLGEDRAIILVERIDEIGDLTDGGPPHVYFQSDVENLVD